MYKTKNLKPILLVSLLLLAAFAISLAGCGGDKKASPAAPQATAPSAAPATPAATPSKPAASQEDTLAAIMLKARSAPGFSYDLVMTAPGFTATSKVWGVKDKMRMENSFEGKKMITLIDGETSYMLDPATNTAMKFSSRDDSEEMLGKADNPTQYEDSIAKGSLKFIENVVYDGVRCRIVTYSTKEDGMSVKMWLREDYGMPMKQEMVSKKGEKMSIEYKNMKIGAQPPDLFKLPAGVKVQDVGAMMPPAAPKPKK